MRNIVVAKSAGFCFGVERAVKILNETVENGEGPIYTYGPIIHNEHVVKEYEKKGVKLYPVGETEGDTLAGAVGETEGDTLAGVLGETEGDTPAGTVGETEGGTLAGAVGENENATLEGIKGETENSDLPQDASENRDLPQEAPENSDLPQDASENRDLPQEAPENREATWDELENSGDKSQSGTIVLRSHGVSKATEDSLKEKGMKIVDATCPFVKKIHIIVEDYSKKGYGIVILGNKDHPEVLGTLGWIENGDYRVVENENDIEKLDFPLDKKLCVVAQTTFRHDKFQIFVDLIRQKGYYIYALNTICSATEVRQDEARRIASKVDVMLVIGDRLSSNSRKLFEICKGQCKQTYFLETSDDLDLQTLQSIQNIGITAGASTPKNIIEEVFEKCQK